jgi:hypothetical protein
MPVDQKVDPFKPQAPAIPGVPAASERSEKAAPQQPAAASAPSWMEQPAVREAGAKMIGVGAGIAVVLLAGVAFLYPSHHSSAKSDLYPSPEAASPAAPAPAPVKTEPAEKLLVGPGPVATTAELAKPWSAREFLFRGTLTPDAVPAMVVRLPGGELWGFSLREPFGQCELQYVTNLKTLETDYGFHAEHPMVVNPCTHAVYDLMRYGGGAPNGGLVRGEIVQGSGVRPPMAIEIRTSGREILAVRGE